MASYYARMDRPEGALKRAQGKSAVWLMMMGWGGGGGGCRSFGVVD